MRMDLAPQELALVPLCEQAIAEGRTLADWCAANEPSYRKFALDPGRRCSLPHRGDAFFGDIEIAGGMRSVMGCRQHMSMGGIGKARSVADVREFVMRDFLADANWTYPGGQQGGFTIRKSICALADGTVAVFAPEESAGPVDWRDLPSIYQWVMLTIDLHDFVLELGSVRKQIRQAVCVVQHPAFCAEDPVPVDASRSRITVGYPFVPFAPLKNYFGFGPGKFGAAVKMYSFAVGSDDALSVDMLFAAAPRCEKVFDFGPGVPDPVYGTVRLIERLSFGMWKPEPFHDWMDSQMLAQHCRVHQALIEGVAANWQAGNGKSGALAEPSFENELG
jgi:hypothetical protein